MVRKSQTQRHVSHNVLGQPPKHKETGKPNRLCQVEECNPWTRKEDLPGRGYKTSSKMGHPRIYPYFTQIEKIPLDVGEDKMIKENPYKNAYNSSYKSAYTKKCDCYGVMDKLNSPHSLKYKMLFNWGEKLRLAPIRKNFEVSTEMRDRYKLHLPDETADCQGLLNDLRPHTLCNIHAVARDAQSKTFSENQCVQKVMDPYITTNQYDYTYYSANEIAKYRHKKAEPAELIVQRKSPVFDETFLRLKFMDRFIRKKTPTVPYSGLTTEVRDNYKLPINELAHKKHLYCSSLIRNFHTKGEVMAIPAMYQTEYNHYGRDWPLSSII